MFIDEPILLIDSDSIYFRAAYVVFDRKTEKLQRNWKKDIRKIIDTTIRGIQGEFSTPHLKAAVKGRDNFRNKVYDLYKANRPSLHEKMKEALSYGHEYMKDKYDAIEANGMEADDLVAIWAYEAREMEAPFIVVGIDKDLLQIPGSHYNFNTKVKSFIDDDAGNLKLMLQCLTGDTADNIPGIKGIGPKKAEKILQGVPMERRWKRVCAAWRAHKAGNPEISRRLLTMVTSWEEYDNIRSTFTSETSISKQDVLQGEE